MSSWGLRSVRRDAPGKAKLPQVSPNMSRFKVGTWWNPALSLIWCVGPPWIEPPFEIQLAKPCTGRAGPVESDQVLPGQMAGEWPLGPPGLGLEVLVYLGHVLHHALPVGPVCVQHGAELLWEKGRGHGGTEPPTRGSGRVRAVPTRNPPRTGHMGSSTKRVGRGSVYRSVFFLFIQEIPSLLKNIRHDPAHLLTA